MNRRAICNEVHVRIPLRPLCDIVVSYDDMRQRLVRHIGHRSVAVLPGAIVVASRGLMSVLDSSTGACKFEFHAPRAEQLCPFGAHVAAAHQNAIRIWNIRTGECIKSVSGFVRAACAMTEWRGNLVSATDDGLVRVWNVEQDEHVYLTTVEGVKSMLEFNGQLILLLQFGSVLVWNGSEMKTIGDGNAKCLCTNGRLLCTGSQLFDAQLEAMHWDQPSKQAVFLDNDIIATLESTHLAHLGCELISIWKDGIRLQRIQYDVPYTQHHSRVVRMLNVEGELVVQTAGGDLIEWA